MRCTDAVAQLSAYLDNELPDQARRVVHGHLLACVACRALAQSMASTSAALGALSPVDPPPDLYARIAQTLAAQDVALSQAATWRTWLRHWVARLAPPPGLRLALAFGAVAVLAALAAVVPRGSQVAVQRAPAAATEPAASSHAGASPAPAADPDASLVAQAADSDTLAVAAYQRAISDLVVALRSQVRLDVPAAQGRWRRIQARLSAHQRAFASAKTAAQRREEAAKTTAFLQDALATEQTQDLLARTSW